jgi:biotin carboxylase
VTGRHVLFVNLRRIPREGLESLLAAHRLGYGIVLIGRSIPDFARPYVDEFREVDTYEADRSVKVAREVAGDHDLAGVANFTEVDVQLVSAIAADLGLPGMPPQAALRARNKFLMKEALAHLDVLPRYRRVRSLDELRAAVADLGLPAVVKPTGASGSKGIFELREPGDLEPAMRRLAEIARPDFDPVFRQFGAEFIVEEFLDGPEVSVEGFVAGGAVHIVAITDKQTSVPFHLELEHKVPSVLGSPAETGITAATRDVVGALGLDHCAFHLEGKQTPRGFRFIEIAGRPAGDYIASHVVPLATGIDFFANVVRVATGEPLELRPDRALHAGVRFVLAPESGRFDGVDGLPEICAWPGYDHVFFEQPVGSRIAVPPEHFGQQRLVAVCARHGTRGGLDALLAGVESSVTPRMIRDSGDG